jgi:hypothetical protein
MIRLLLPPVASLARGSLRCRDMHVASRTCIQPPKVACGNGPAAYVSGVAGDELRHESPRWRDCR